MPDRKKIQSEIAEIKKKLGLNEDGVRGKAGAMTLFLRNVTGYNKRGVSGGETVEERRLKRKLKELEQQLFDTATGEF